MTPVEPMKPVTPTPTMQDVQPDSPLMPRETAAQEVPPASVAPVVPTPSTPRPAVPAGQPPVAPPATIGQGWKWFLRSLGVVFAFAAGVAYAFALGAVWGHPEAQTVSWLVLFGFAGSVLGATVAAALFRSWWALLIVTVVFYVGYVLQPLLSNSLNVQLWLHFLNPVTGLYLNPIALLFIVPPAIVGVVIGVPIGKWVVQRVRR